jgi:hypothetical protein
MIGIVSSIKELQDPLLFILFSYTKRGDIDGNTSILLSGGSGLSVNSGNSGGEDGKDGELHFFFF